MKKFLILFAIVLLASCADQEFMEEIDGEKFVTESANIVQALVEKAKWGDGQAYLKLADCYRDGNGVKKDLIGLLSMVSIAEQFGALNRMEDYLDSMADDSEFKLIIDAVNLYEHKKEKANAKIERLSALESPDSYSVMGLIAVERGDTLEGKQLLEMAASQGSTFAELLLCFPDWRNTANPDVEKLVIIVDRVPFACKLLGDMYTGREDESKKDEVLAAYYYMKAGEKAHIGKRGAIWLLNYHRNGGIPQLSEQELQRLQALAGITIVEEADNDDGH